MIESIWLPIIAAFLFGAVAGIISAIYYIKRKAKKKMSGMVNDMAGIVEEIENDG